MITLDLNIDNTMKKVKIKEDVLFNAILSEHPEMIKKIIKTIYFSYDISDAFFTIVNSYIDFTNDGISIYPGLIVRTGLYDFAVLYLENTEIEEEYMVNLIKEFLHDAGHKKTIEANINKFEVDKKTFLNAAKNI